MQFLNDIDFELLIVDILAIIAKNVKFELQIYTIFENFMFDIYIKNDRDYSNFHILLESSLENEVFYSEKMIDNFMRIYID